MHVSFHEGYRVDLPPTHPYPMGKYLLLRALLDERGVSSRLSYREPSEVPLEVLRQVHTDEYLRALAADALTPHERRQLGIPFTPRLWRRSRLTVEGTRMAAQAALRDGLAANLAGGNHHAFADHGEGFCVLNDVAVAINDLRAQGEIRRALVVDLDVHQGNGTAAIFADCDVVYTLSLHGERNYPFTKPASDCDIGLADGLGDREYLAALRPALSGALNSHRPDIVIYIAGVDVVAHDRYGRLALTEDGLRARERHVIETVRDAAVPLAIVLGGGYASSTQRTAELHAIVFEEALLRWEQERR
jgi:acetoin utilization deacetylase AcuC-like enzyme